MVVRFVDNENGYQPFTRRYRTIRVVIISSSCYLVVSRRHERAGNFDGLCEIAKETITSRGKTTLLFVITPDVTLGRSIRR